MIKVIASDMDGTLLGDNHKVAPETVEAIREAQAAGIRFMIATGRSYNGAMEELKGLDLGCDFIVGSGAEIRNPKGEILKSIGFTYEVCNEVAKVLEEYPISVLYCAGPYEYRVGTPEEVEESIVRQIQLFHLSECRDQIEQSELYKRVKASSRRIDSVDELEKQGIMIHKIFLFTGDLEMLDKIKRRLMQNPELGMSTFTVQVEIARSGLVKLNTPFYQLFYLSRSLFHHLFDSGPVAMPIAGNQCILNMLFEIVNGVGYRCYTSLGVIGIRFL